MAQVLFPEGRKQLASGEEYVVDLFIPLERLKTRVFKMGLRDRTMVTPFSTKDMDLVGSAREDLMLVQASLVPEGDFQRRVMPGGPSTGLSGIRL